jgi:hypothetical protein
MLRFQPTSICETQVKRGEYAMKKRYHLGDQKGVVLLLVMGSALVLSISSGAFMQFNANEIQMAQRQMDQTQTFYISQAGIAKAFAETETVYQGLGAPSAGDLAAITPPNFPGYTWSNFDVQFTSSGSQTPITQGTFTGMQAFVRPILITAEAQSQTTGSTIPLSQTVDSQLISLFQFGVFYYEDLEILPGPQMNFAGPVHSNQNIYIAAGSELSFESTVTSAKDIYHARKDGGSAGSANVRLKDGDGVYQSMKEPGGNWLDSNASNWDTESQNRWDGKVRSKEHDVPTIELAFWPSEATPHEIIERGSAEDSSQLQSAKYYYKADLKIIDGLATDKNGNSVDLTYTSNGVVINPVETKQFYNAREGTNVQVTQVNIEQLNTSGKMPTNGILYVSDTRGSVQGLQDGVRLVDGAELPSGGLTVVTDNPMYLKGDYNTVNKKPAAVINDATTILSNAWNDSNSTKNLNSRHATDATINTAIMTGNTTTTPGNYNGGLENLPRFLEKWTGKKFTYRGSIVDLWLSVQATGAWKYGAPQYTAPIRDWAYDTNFEDPANQPPGAPSVVFLQKNQWRYE